MNLVWLGLILIGYLTSVSQCSSIIGIEFSSGKADGVNVTTKSGFTLDKGE
jgi:hypothetical protein